MLWQQSAKVGNSAESLIHSRHIGCGMISSPVSHTLAPSQDRKNQPGILEYSNFVVAVTSQGILFDSHEHTQVTMPGQGKDRRGALECFTLSRVPLPRDFFWREAILIMPRLECRIEVAHSNHRANEELQNVNTGVSTPNCALLDRVSKLLTTIVSSVI